MKNFIKTFLIILIIIFISGCVTDGYFIPPNDSYYDEMEFVGEVLVKKTYWHLFFIGANPDNKRDELTKLLREKVFEEYGEGAIIKNVEFHSEWNPASLLFYFSMMGFVENAKMSASIYSAVKPISKENQSDLGIKSIVEESENEEIKLDNNEIESNTSKMVDDVRNVTYQENVNGYFVRYTNKNNPQPLLPNSSLYYYLEAFDPHKKDTTSAVEERDYMDDRYVIFKIDRPDFSIIIDEKKKNLLISIAPKLKSVFAEQVDDFILRIFDFNIISYDRFENSLIIEEGTIADTSISLINTMAEDNYDLVDGFYSSIGIKCKLDLSDNTLNSAYQFIYIGLDWIFADSVKLLIDNEMVEFNNLDFIRDNSSNIVWEYSTLVVNENYKNIALKLSQTEAEDNVIRFYGTQYYSDKDIINKVKTAMRKYMYLLDFF